MNGTLLLGPTNRCLSVFSPYVHGRMKKVRTNGVAAVVKAEPHEMIVVDVPEWRIDDDETWLAVQARFSKRAPYRTLTKPHAKYPLTGIARCAHCGRAIAWPRRA